MILMRFCYSLSLSSSSNIGYYSLSDKDDVESLKSTIGYDFVEKVGLLTLLNILEPLLLFVKSNTK